MVEPPEESIDAEDGRVKLVAFSALKLKSEPAEDEPVSVTDPVATSGMYAARLELALTEPAETGKAKDGLEPIPP